jgi:hypothetical protein
VSTDEVPRFSEGVLGEVRARRNAITRAARSASKRGRGEIRGAGVGRTVKVAMEIVWTVRSESGRSEKALV